MRGLDTAGPWFASSLPFVSNGANAIGSLNQIEDCPDRPLRPAVHSEDDCGAISLLFSTVRIEWLRRFEETALQQ
jgi:hypothetical protein